MYDVLVYLPASQHEQKDEPPSELMLELDLSAVAPITAHIKKCVLRGFLRWPMVRVWINQIQPAYSLGTSSGQRPILL